MAVLCLAYSPMGAVIDADDDCCLACHEHSADIFGSACADTFLDAEESEEEDADRGAYDYKDLAAAFDSGGYDGLSQSDTSGEASLSGSDDEDDEAEGSGPFKAASKGKQPKQRGNTQMSELSFLRHVYTDRQTGDSSSV